MRRGYLLVLLTLLSSCGYSWGGSFSSTPPTLSVPFISGDSHGILNREIVRALEVSGIGSVQNHDPDFRLDVEIQDHGVETVGYRFAREKISGDVSKNLVSTEARRTLKVIVSVYDLRQEKLFLGPYDIQADADYDYLAGDSFQDLTFFNQQGTLTKVLPFSLGQLEPDEAASEAAIQPVYSQIAEKIVDVLSAEILR